eukprot:CAMPEP_0168256748 /NCGR_PEP_ID=MMETSP0141_2-20121125/6078_1 /TAXON_ID=44445 /ORGANISM="Pseudo-nitzschia australis, Strain 10249 10 AB" /LENGTH=619 /DNA_ID=CAMNT_0008193585 /DNA_START=136 /DNA_END=1995 /DNA_ORIENTATION=+
MPSSQLLSSFLCIGCLIFVANGFSTIYTPISRMVLHGPIHGDATSQQPEQSRADGRRHTGLRAAKKASKSSASSSSSSSDKVKEMAAFVSVQLLEKVMAEVMNPEAESKMDLAAVERITKALQMSSQPRSEGVSTKPSEEETTTTIKEEEPSVTTDLPDDTALASSEDDDSSSSSISSSSSSSSSTAEMETLEKPTMEAKEEIVVPVAETPAPPPSTPEIKVKPLEVVQSNIPALRPESIPQRKPDTEEVTDATESTEGSSLVEEIASETQDEEEVVEHTESSEETADDTAATDTAPSNTEEIDTATTDAEEIDTATIDAEEIDAATTDAEESDTTATDAEEIDTVATDAEESDTATIDAEESDTATTDAEEIDTEAIDTAAILEKEKAEEGFHRRLLKQKLEYDDAREVRIENDEKENNKEDEKEVDATSSPAVEATSDEGIEEESDDDSSSDSVPSEKAQTEAETTGVSDSDESKQDTNEDEEEPTETDSDGVNTAVLSEPVEAEEPTEADSDDVNTAVRSEPTEAEEVPPPTAATTPPPTTSERRVETIVALRQPKSCDEESKLAEKYAEMKSLEDRAYALLCDLGMIEAHKNPEDPSYDHSKDDEYCEQRFLPLL